MLQIDTKDAEGVTVLSLCGRLILGTESQSLAEHIKQLVKQQKTTILLNMEQLTFIDSCGVGELVAGFTTVRKSGGTLKLSCARQRVLEILQIVRIPQVVELYNTEHEALASFV
jgi:anti-sigma B factor antagonist